jgi:trehalose 6-phosphate synthase
MSRLVIVSNRVADLRQSQQSGGLAVGVADALKARGGVWFGWSGETVDKPTEEPVVEQLGKVETVSLPVAQRDFADYYIGYSNSVLWPLFHYRLDLVDYRPSYFKGYQRVNRLFAKVLSRFLRPGDVIWAHDYHLIPLAAQLRRHGCRQRIGFFLHIPFPPPELLAASPNHAELVDALLQYDLIGFQTQTDVGNFRRYVEQHTDAVTAPDGSFIVAGRTVRADRFPIGIDVEAFRAMAQAPQEDVRIDTMRRHILGRQQIIGVDRLDYSKGLPERMRAFSRLLALKPELEGKVSFLQIAPPTREDVTAYAQIREELEHLTGSINGRLADFNWTPIRYIHRSVPRETLAALFRASQVGFVTPLRDGMNLVAKEYVAAQDPEDPGVLVLSQFAGAAEEMHEALIVNPYDIDEMARSLAQALAMPLAERQERHLALLASISRLDARAWMRSFLDELERPAVTPLPSNGGGRVAAMP